MPEKTAKVKDTKKKPQDPLEKFREVFGEVKTPAGGLPMMSTKISGESSDTLGNMISRYSAWREFTEDRHAEACAVYAQVKSEYDFACDKAMLNAREGTVTEKKAEAKTGNIVAPLAKKVLEASIYMDLLARKLDSFSNVLSMLSRELTRRGVMNA